MHFTSLSLALAAAAMVGQTVALPPGLCGDGPNLSPCAAKEKRGSCNHDNLLRSFLDPRYSTSASSFCSSYIESTTTLDVTATETSTATVTTTVPAGGARMHKRGDFSSVTTYGSSRLSSACSCLITAPATVTATTTDATTTTTATVTTTVIGGTGSCDVGPGYTASSAYLGQIGTAASPAACKAICASTSTCVAFAFGTRSNGCYGYSLPIAQDNFSGDASSEYFFYDNTCFP